MESLGKKTQNYEDIHNKTCVYEQKPVKIDGFNEAKEKRSERVRWKMKIKRREVTEKNKRVLKKEETRTR